MLYMHACQIASAVSDSLWPYGLQPTRLLCPWDSPSKHTEVGCLALLQGTVPTQRSKLHLLCLLHWQARFFTTSTTMFQRRKENWEGVPQNTFQARECVLGRNDFLRK